jgi:hypothetical protein
VLGAAAAPAVVVAGVAADADDIGQLDTGPMVVAGEAA